MPAVVAFGRRWACGTDDFVFPGFLDTVVKSFWLSSALYSFFRQDIMEFQCKVKLLIYLYGMMASLFLIILVDLIAIKQSAKGSIMNTEIRKSIPYLIYLRLFMEVLDTGWNILGTVWVFGTTFSGLLAQDPVFYYFIRRYIICNWISLFILALFFAFLYDSLGSLEEKPAEIYYEAQSKFWEKKLQAYCSVFGNRSRDKEGIFEAIGKNVASILKQTTFVNSDGIAALFAIFRLEEDKAKESVTRIRESDGSTLDKTNSEGDLELIERLQSTVKFLEFTRNKRSWNKLMSNRHHHPFFKALEQFKSYCSAGARSTKIFEANGVCSCCKVETLNMLASLGISESDMCYISSKQSYYEFSFIILKDPSSKSLVINIFGGMSVSNVITFMDAMPVALDHGIHQNSAFKVHGGLYIAAKRLKQVLESLEILKTLKTNDPDFHLVLVGNSFGGGVAAILGMTLKTEFPNLQVVCINPPGGIFSLDAANYSEEFMTSFVFGDDAISKISINSIEELRRDLIDIMYKCTTPKYKLLTSILLRPIGFKLNVRLDSSTNADKVGYENKVIAMSKSFEENVPNISRNSIVQDASVIPTQPPMFLPGKIVHVKKSQGKFHYRGRGNPVIDQQYNIQWGKRSEFCHITLLPTMLAHHRSEARVWDAVNELLNFNAGANLTDLSLKNQST